MLENRKKAEICNYDHRHEYDDVGGGDDQNYEEEAKFLTH